MNAPDDRLREYFGTRRAGEKQSAPAFAAMSARVRTLAAADRRGSPQSHALWWLASATAALILGLWLLKTQVEPDTACSDRLAALLAEMDPPAFAQASLPSDQIPSAFSEP